ncbi:amidase domain-containing protein [Caldisalinibacter kiritimatiensis]|uniref:Putative amidase domain-containing protein n=1 Tax=Caldisalinibacter kiritimatiensis TaxID=1304284 RepID=R1CRE6_9FIRM|nr:amidase domain-containing protein [Caldisalinibacter kiritimatiensis]EOC99283.1 hypothetical protein L21TH_2696 [Caldisalinibacter kiritimatiensis]
MKKVITIVLCITLLFINTFSMASTLNNEDTIKDTIESFYNTQYDSYLEMKYKDITPYLDMSKIQNRNKVIALKTLAIRRKYIDEKGYGYVEKRRFPLTFNYKSIDIKNDYAKVILEINLDKQQAYPPFISSGENIFYLKKYNDTWKIIEHDYIGLKMFESSKVKLLLEKKKDELFKTIDKEYAIDKTKEYKNYNEDEEQSEVGVLSLPAENHYYSSSRGVYYANKYVINGNIKFYEASTSGGDCTNFASQVLWYGFGANDTTEDIANKEMMVSGSTYSEGWYAGSGGGSRNWESVNYFWNYMTGYKSIDTPGPRVSVVSSVSSLNEGGIMQIDFESDSDYDHTVILVDEDTLKFAQHSPNKYYYYSDYSGSKRFFNPSYFREIL